MEQETFDFWQDHSDRYLKMAFAMERCERLTNPDGYGKNVGDCGDTVEFFLTVKDDRILFASFDIDGCMNTRACANTVAELTEGKTVANAWTISPEAVIDYLETLPATSHHCAELAVGAFYQALTDFQKKRQYI